MDALRLPTLRDLYVTLGLEMNNFSQVLLGLILTFWFSSVIACTNENKDCAIDKKTWINRMSSYIPAEFCKSDSAFIRCYKVSQSRCLDLSSKLTKKCIAKKEKALPMLFNKEDSIKWGSTIGGCAGDKLTDKIKFKTGKNTSCLNEQ
jgi:hypothetical protein